MDSGPLFIISLVNLACAVLWGYFGYEYIVGLNLLIEYDPGNRMGLVVALISLVVLLVISLSTSFCLFVKAVRTYDEERAA